MVTRAAGTPAVRRGTPRVGYAVAVLGLVLLAAGLRADFTGSGVPGVVFSRSDERHYVELATDFLNGRWRVDYFVNPTFYAYVLYGVTALVGRVMTLVGAYASYADFVSEATRSTYVVTLVGRSLTFACAVASVPVLYLVGKRLVSPVAGSIAAAALTLDRVHVSRSALVGNETLLVLLVLLFFLATLRYLAGPTARRHALCGVLLGLAVSTKYTGGLHAVTLLVATLLAARAQHRRGAGWARELRGARYWIGLPLAGLAFLAAAPYVLLDWSGFVRELAFLASFHAGGERTNITSSGWVYYPLAYAGGPGAPFALLAACGLAWSLYRALARADPRGWLLPAAIVPAYVSLGSADYKLVRYLLVAVPFLALAGAWALEAACTRLARALPGRASAAGPGIALALGAVLLLPHGIGTQRRAALRIARSDPRAELLEWLYGRLDLAEPCIDFSYGARCRFFAEPDPAPGDAPDAPFGERLFRSTQLRRVLGSRPDFESFRERVTLGPERYLVCSFWADALPAELDPRETCSRLLELLARNYGFDERFEYWEEARELLDGLELSGYAIGRNRRHVLFVLELP